MSPKIITLITDFGHGDSYVGSLKGAILSINPFVTLVDISHEVSPFNILEAGFLLRTSSNYFPEGTIHLAVVDPGVGSSRKPLLLVTPLQTFIGPDNGIFSHVLKDDFLRGNTGIASHLLPVPENIQAYNLNNPKFWIQPVSRTFHARDVFGPVAAHLSLGVSPELMGEKVETLETIQFPSIKTSGSGVQGAVISVDRFGNLITNIEPSIFSELKIAIRIKGHVVNGLSQSYAQGKPLLAIIGSHGFLEIAFKEGNAADYLGVGVGESVLVEFV